MSIFKRATSKNKIMVSSTVYLCKSCGHTKIVKDGLDEDKECPKCHAEMDVVHSETSEK